MLKKYLFLLMLLCFYSSSTFAQAQNSDIEMADGLRSSGKIYVVVAVMLIIFVGLAIYLIKIDKKISALEKQQNKDA